MVVAAEFVVPVLQVAQVKNAVQTVALVLVVLVVRKRPVMPQVLVSVMQDTLTVIMTILANVIPVLIIVPALVA